MRVFISTSNLPGGGYYSHCESEIFECPAVGKELAFLPILNRSSIKSYIGTVKDIEGDKGSISLFLSNVRTL